MKNIINSINTEIYYSISIKKETKVKYLLKQLNFNPESTFILVNHRKADLNSKIYQLDKIILITSLEQPPSNKSLIKDALPDLLLLDELRLTKVDPDTLLKERKCFKCGNQLYFRYYISQNRNEYAENLIKTWQSPQVEIYCCTCYNLIEKERMLEEICILQICGNCWKFIKIKDIWKNWNMKNF